MNSNVTGSSPDPLLNGSLTTNDSLGSTEDGTMTIPQTPLPTTAKTATADVAPSEFQVFEGVDILDSGRIVVQQFLSEAQWGKKEYPAERNPVLRMPQLDEAIGPQPFEPSWQKAANKFFRDQVKEVIINKVKESGESAPFFQELNKDSEGKSAEATTTSPKGQPQKEMADEEPSEREGAPELPKPFIEAQVNAIIQAVVSDKTATLNKESQEIVAKATEKTQKAWSLPASWALGTQEIKDWTPITTDVVAPVNVDICRREFIVQNIEKLCTSIKNAGTKMMEEFPPNDPNRVAVRDLILVVSQALRDLKGVLQDLQIKEADISTKMSAAKKEQIDERIKQLEATALKREEIQKTQEEKQQKAQTTKLFTTLASIVVTFIATAISILTLGAGTPLLVAVVIAVIGIATIAYTVLDFAFDLTSKIVGKFNSLIEQTGAPNWVKTCIKIAALALVATILIFAIAASGGAAAGTIAAQIAKQVANMTIQFAIMFIMASNILPDLIINALIQSGAISKDDEKTKMIIQMIITAITMILTMGAMAKFSGAGTQIFKSIGTTVADGFKAVVNAIKDIGSAIAKIAKEVTENGLRAAVEELKQMIIAFGRMIKQMMSALVQAGVEIKDAFKNSENALEDLSTILSKAGKTIKTSFDSTKEAISQSGERLLKALSDLREFLANTAKEAGAVVLQELSKVAKDTLEALRDFWKNLGPNLKAGLKEIFVPEALIKSFRNIKSSIIEQLNPGVVLEREIINWKTFAKNAQSFFQISGFTAEATGAFCVGLIGLQFVEKLKELGELEKAQEVTQLLIKLFQKLLDSLQEGLTSKSEWINSLDRALASIFGSGSQTLTKFTQQA